MKTFIISFILVLAGSQAMSQSLKDSLFKGKLKNPLADAAKAKDSAKAASHNEVVLKDSVAVKTAETTSTTPTTPTTPEINPDNTMPDSLNKLYYAHQKTWERFVKSQTLLITQEADESRKVKKGEYYVEIEYEIGVNGRVKPINITCSPKNDFLMEKFTEMMSRPPVLAPQIYGDGKPRASTAKQEITILKK